MHRFDQNKMVRLISEIRKSLERLRHLSELQEADFLNDPDKIASAKYHFIVAIEAGIDMCNHVISKNEMRIPEDYSDTFRVMEEQGAFDKNFADTLVKMAKFRNRLVHLYWEVDDKTVYRILKNHLDDFKRFLGSFADFLGWKNAAD
ncbi:MAG: DUF86 domain-containing protein [Deltaproteobacteria bacterium]|nr:DUF86 domain-containing protein [Deltaproteobacteria bacterium]